MKVAPHPRGVSEDRSVPQTHDNEIELGTRAMLALSCAAIACGGPACTGVSADLPSELPRASAVDELRVRRGDFEQRVLLTGTLEATRGVRITPPRTPTWQVQIRWMEEDGVQVEAGQKVLELDNTAFAADLEDKQLAARKEQKEIQQQQAEGQAQTAELTFTLAQRQVELDKAEIDADVPKELIPLREYQDKQLALERARTAFSKAEEELQSQIRTAAQEIEIRRANLRKTLYDIRVAETAIRELSLEAPTAGVLIIGDVRRENRKLQVGDTVWPGYVVARIPDLTEMRVEAQLSDVDDGQVEVGMEASVWLDSYPGLRLSGEVRDITPVAQETSPRSLRRSFRVRISLDDTDPDRMRPGMAAKVELRAVGEKDVLLVPRAAVDFRPATPVAFRDNGDLVELRLGRCNPAECIVEAGLEEGARLERRPSS